MRTRDGRSSGSKRAGGALGGRGEERPDAVCMAAARPEGRLPASHSHQTLQPVEQSIAVWMMKCK